MNRCVCSCSYDVCCVELEPRCRKCAIEIILHCALPRHGRVLVARYLSVLLWNTQTSNLSIKNIRIHYSMQSAQVNCVYVRDDHGFAFALYITTLGRKHACLNTTDTHTQCYIVCVWDLTMAPTYSHKNRRLNGANESPTSSRQMGAIGKWIYRLRV